VSAPITRRRFICQSAAGLAAGLASVLPGRPSAPRRPNIVFILADDLGWRDTSFTGSAFYETPNVERLARRGMYFPQAYAASPLCSPTRASILTGLHPARIGITSPVCHEPREQFDASRADRAPAHAKRLECQSATRLGLGYRTLAETLRDAGYATGHFGKWHLGRPPYDALHQGFDVDVPHWPGPGPARSYVAPWAFPAFAERVPEEHIEDRMGDEAVAFMEQHRDRPFFLNYWMFSVHAPFDAKARLIERYRKRADTSDPQHSPTYAAMVRSMDDNIGKVLDGLDRLGIAGNTIVVFFSDNGGNMYNEVDGTTPTNNSPLRGGKATVYEGGIRVPCIVVWPGIVPGGSTSRALVHSTDFYPTLLEMASVPVAADQRLDGESLVPVLRRRAVPDRCIFSYFPHDPHVPDWLPPSVCVRRGDWKLIRIFHDGPDQEHRYELYNLSRDMGERHSLADAEPDRVRELDALIDAFLVDTVALVPKPNPAYDPTALASVGGWTVGGNGHAGFRLAEGYLQVTIMGNDPIMTTTDPLGIPAGPYTFAVRMRSSASGDGLVFAAGPSRQVVPGTGVPFPVKHDSQWHDYAVPLSSADGIGLLRLDPCTGDGEVGIESIRLTNAAGDEVRSWEFRTAAPRQP